ncbi:TspO/MBR family protein [Ruegeria arenilitoris]|uniref:TspO/MBR family protein n=1 Tax=Ruegeria arenilitoris TaxID=1173585 RepID=UPI00147C68B8|nr:TspO/MBR family protein [Ruegeria arenilitoris]
MSNWLIRIVFLAFVMGGGILIGILTAPGDWYAQLSKPVFNPPNWIFGPVWTVLYVLIAITGWRQFEADRSSSAMKLWWAQMGLNFLWSPTFFVLQMPWLALVVIVALLIVIGIFIARVKNSDRVSALAFLPYLAWVAFASALNLSIAILN